MILPKKIQLVLAPSRHGFEKSGIVEIEPDRILCNDITFPWEYHPHNMSLWVIGSAFGPLGAVWASNESDAIDELIDNNLAAGILLEEGDADEDAPRGGNAGEPYDQTSLWIGRVLFERKADENLIKQIAWLAEARGQGCDKLSDLS